ncbi:putative nuclease HARBI1 [Diadema antillarum]|uniref:putative nuclease HARBI1 n=1 Tax=Diadema antillarum TaxID=105358 RepID=UPI003A84FAF1
MAALLHLHENYQLGRERIHRRLHPLQIYNDVELIKRYRFNGEGIHYITNLIRHDITPKGNNNHPIDPIDKVCIALHVLATGCFQRTDGDTLGISQASVSRIVQTVCTALTDRLPHFVRLPQGHEQVENMMKFYQIARFPGVIGLIDGTHVKIQAPTEDEHQFVNRKRFHSINVQVVLDADAKIINLNAQWPGSVHDSRVLRESGLQEVLQDSEGHLLGDSGYPLKCWLLTPIARPSDDAEERYNLAHKRTRCLVERGIGQLKRRFHCLHGELRYKPEKASCIVAACAILHNLAKDMRIPLIAEDIQGYDQPDQELHQGMNHNVPRAYRRHIVESHF